MKLKLKSLLLITLSHNLLFGQIEIQESDFANAGDAFVYKMQNYTQADSITESMFHVEQQQWDFSNSMSSSLDSVFVLNAAESEYGSDFPNANMALQTENNELLYLIKDERGVQINGIVSDINSGCQINLELENNVTYIEFPYTLGDSFTTEGTGSATFTRAEFNERCPIDGVEIPSYVSQVRVDITYTLSKEVAMYGLARISENTELEVLREVQTNTIVANVSVYALFGWVSLGEVYNKESTTISWLAKEYGLPIAEMFLEDGFASYIRVLNVTEPDSTVQIIELQEGWNQVYLNVSPSNQNIAELFPHCLVVKTQDLFFDATQPEYFNTLNSMELGNNYYIYNTIAEQIEIEGE